jgi:hypothetical protein
MYSPNPEQDIGRGNIFFGTVKKKLNKISCVALIPFLSATNNCPKISLGWMVI